jgi:hypothetical protein
MRKHHRIDLHMFTTGLRPFPELNMHLDDAKHLSPLVFPDEVLEVSLFSYVVRGWEEVGRAQVVSTSAL